MPGGCGLVSAIGIMGLLSAEIVKSKKIGLGGEYSGARFGHINLKMLIINKIDIEILTGMNFRIQGPS